MLVLYAAIAHGSAVPWMGGLYSHVSQEEDLTELLRSFGASYDLNTVVSERVTGVVSGRFLRLPPEVFLKNICTAFGLLWYFDGNTLFFYRSDEELTKVITLENLPFAQLRDVLQMLGVVDPRFALRPLADEGVVYVSGPPRYVELVVEIASRMDEKSTVDSQVKAAREVIRVFPLSHAWADDQTFSFMDREITVQGVASILRHIFAGYGVGEGGAEDRLRMLPRTVDKLKGKGLVSKGRPPEEETVQPPSATAADMASQGPEDEKGGRVVESAAGASIMADTRLNAVIIRDIEERVPFYEEMIRLLDVPVGLVQIQATIMDIKTDYLYELGVNWRFRTENSAGSVTEDGKIITAGGLDADEDFQPGSESLVVGRGLNFVTIVGSAAEYLLARVRAMEEDGKARVLSQPSVLTLDNLEAQLEHSQTFYVRVPGDQEVDLFAVTAGIVLRVTPHIIEDAEGRKIKLGINIEDGNVSDSQQVDDIPIVQKSTINTQAVVKEDQSLLIGGYYHETQFKTSSGIPCLMRLPFFGTLFREDQTVAERAERMFLITPRIVLHDAYPSVESRVSYPGGGPETPAVVPGGATRIRLNELEIRSE